MKLACAYARCSTDDQAGSLPAQWTQLEAFAARGGYQIVEKFEDDGISGTSMDRPGLMRLLRAAENGANWSFVLVWDRSRLGRPEDPREAIVVTYNIERHGKSIVPLHGTQSTGNPILDTMLEAIEFGQAGEESIRKSRDVLRGQREAARKGSNPAGKPPYAYDALYVVGETPIRRIRFCADRTKQVLTSDGKSVIETLPRGRRIGKSNAERLLFVPGDPKKVEIVRRVFQEFNSGHSSRTIASDLNAIHIPSPFGKTWGRSSILRILENPAYKGTLAWNRHSWAKFHNVGEDGNIVRVSNPTKRLKTNPEQQWETTEDLWVPVVSKEEWENAQALMKRPKHPAVKGKGTHSVFLVSGLLHCSCGFHLIGCGFADKRKPGHRYEYYRCLARSEKGLSVCAAKRIPRLLVDSYVERRIQERYFEPSMKNAFWKELGRQLDEALADLESSDASSQEHERLADVKEQIKRLVEAVAEGMIDRDEIKDKMSALRSKKAEIEARIAATTSTDMRSVDMKVLRQNILDGCRERIRQERSLWPSATAEQRKSIVRAHIAGMAVDHDKHTIRTEFYPLIAEEDVGFHNITCSCCVKNQF